MKQAQIIASVYDDLKGRSLHPAGRFDKGGRWYAENSDLISVRSPSHAWPFSEMKACRTRKYVKAVCEKFNCKTEKALRQAV